MKIKEIKNARRLENGAIDCEVLFEGMDDAVPYTATPMDTAATGQQIWQELQSGKWGEIIPFTATQEMIDSIKASKRQEIEAWRLEQEAQALTFEWNGRIWDGGADSLARLSPITLAAKLLSVRDIFVWYDASNSPVSLVMSQVAELVAAMAEAQLERNNVIYTRQREMKNRLEEMDKLDEIRRFCIG